MLRSLLALAATDVELAKRVAGYAWLVDGVTADESGALRALNTIASQDISVARTIVEMRWFAHDLGEFGWELPVTLQRLADRDVELARSIAGLPWLSDDLRDVEYWLVRHLDGIASSDLELARLVAGLAWLADDVTEGERVIVSGLDNVASVDIEVARSVAESPWFEGDPRSALKGYLLRSLNRLAASGADTLRLVADKPWFRDGLDQAEAAVVVTLGAELRDNEAYFNDLLSRHYVQVKTLSLPKGGERTIWIVQSTPFSADEDLPTVIGETTSMIEGFLGLPLPTTDVILLVENLPQGHSPWYAGEHRGSHIKLNREYGESIERWMTTIAHELTHYYRFGPAWFNESAANLVAAHIRDERGDRSLAEQGAATSENVHYACSDDQIATITHGIFVDRHFRIAEVSRCTRALGLGFLLEALDIIGEEGMASALREVYTPEGGRYADEEAIYRALLGLTTPGQRDTFRDLYRRLHGGPYSDPDVDRSDDHGDAVEFPTDIEVGSVITGALDYRFDFDYFRFRAEANQKYRFDVIHETLPASGVMLFSDARNRELPKAKVRTSSGPLVQWIAPRSREYYFAVLGLRGETGSYSFTITHVPDVPDDHGDNVTEATDISAGQVIEGVVDDNFDLDYFRLPVITGKSYEVTIRGEALQDCCVSFYSPNRMNPVWTSSGFGWRAVITGVRYLIVGGGHENTGSYTLRVTESD